MSVGRDTQRAPSAPKPNPKETRSWLRGFRKSAARTSAVTEATEDKADDDEMVDALDVAIFIVMPSRAKEVSIRSAKDAIRGEQVLYESIDGDVVFGVERVRIEPCP